MADGKDYRARVNVSNTAGDVIAAAGECCDRVDASALEWLEACGAVERLEAGTWHPVGDIAVAAESGGE